MLSKQWWRVMHNDDLLISQCLKAMYFPMSNLLRVSIGYCPSYTWRNILQVHINVIEKSGIWGVRIVIKFAYDMIIGFLIKIVTRIDLLNLLILISCLSLISYITIFNTGISLNEVFLLFEAQQNL